MNSLNCRLLFNDENKRTPSTVTTTNSPTKTPRVEIISGSPYRYNSNPTINEKTLGQREAINSFLEFAIKITLTRVCNVPNKISSPNGENRLVIKQPITKEMENSFLQKQSNTKTSASLNCTIPNEIGARIKESATYKAAIRESNVIFLML